MTTAPTRVLELEPDAAIAIRTEIERSDGNEVCFLARIDDNGRVHSPRAVARGNSRAVLAAVRGAEPGGIVLHNHPSGDLTPSDADLAVAAELYANGLGLAITDSRATTLYVVVDPAPVESVEPIDPAEMDSLLGEDGPVARAHPAYEDREGQRELARAIVEAYNHGGIRVAEAGTGIGKSIAYLLPAVLWATRNRERTVVSTNTINLQEQLILKDLPFVRRALGIPFRFALVKGRHNYISIRRAHLALATAPALLDEGAQQAELNALGGWLETTRDGSLQDLSFQPSAETWDEVVSDPDACLRARCPHFESCFYQRARRDAASADVLVVNHHLLFSDLAVRRAHDNFTAAAVLPPYRRLILDEAHNLEDAATSHLGAQVTRRGLLRALGRLDRRGRGVLGVVEVTLLKERVPDMLRQDALELIAGLRKSIDRARERVGDLFTHLEALLVPARDGVVRLDDGFAWDEAWRDGGAESVEAALILLAEVARDTGRLRERIAVDRRWADALASELIELRGAESRLGESVAALRTVLQPAEDAIPLVRWLERRGAGQTSHVAACAAPVDLSGALRTGLFERISTAVLTSATLATREGFQFVRGRLGLGAGLRVHESVHPSPFCFEEQAVVALPDDLPAPRGDDARFDAAAAAIIDDLARITDGGVFALFTSHRGLRAVAAALRRRGVEGRWPMFAQGEAPRWRLLEQFREAGDGLLLGVNSFWEGVDVPGQALRGLVLVKLPFKVPTEPLTAARIEVIERDGGNGFTDYMLPHAALRLKQGFGRLIRTRSDRGAIVILDRRIRERGYGRTLLRSLPPAPVRSGAWQDLREQLRSFYHQGRLDA